MENSESIKWIYAMKEELKSMEYNKVWEIVELQVGRMQVGFQDQTQQEWKN